MKRFIISSAIIMVVILTISCKPNLEATRQAYERAMQGAIERPTITADTPTDGAITEIQPMVEQSTIARERTESVRVIEEGTLDHYNIVVGSFKQLTNARSLRDRLIADGYNALVAQNAQSMYRVVACSFGTRSEAESAMAELSKRYPHFTAMWLLVRN